MGPLQGVRIVEIAGIGPGPFCAMLLADLGADVLRVERADAVLGGDPAQPLRDFLNRGRRSVGVDLKHPQGVEVVLRMCETADALIEGFRPGVMERLGLGPDECTARNRRLVYGRMTGWGQDGPLARAAGHDINYISITGALHTFARQGHPPTPPANIVGDFGGGGMFLALGVVAALHEAQGSGQGQVVDAAMVDGTATLMTMIYSMRELGFWQDEPGTNMLDTGAPFYDVYECADGGYVSVGAIEPKFYRELLARIGVDTSEMPAQMNQTAWADAKQRLAAVFKTRTRDEWVEALEGTDACVAGVLSIPEAFEHPHLRARGTFTEYAGITQPAPAPRFSRTRSEIQRPPSHIGQHTTEALAEWGFGADELAAYREAGAIR